MTRWAGFFLCLWSCKTEKEGPTFWIHVIWSTWATFLVFVHFPPIPLLCCLYIQVCVYVYILILLFFSSNWYHQRPSYFKLKTVDKCPNRQEFLCDVRELERLYHQPCPIDNKERENITLNLWCNSFEVRKISLMFFVIHKQIPNGRKSYKYWKFYGVHFGVGVHLLQSGMG